MEVSIDSCDIIENPRPRCVDQDMLCLKWKRSLRTNSFLEVLCSYSPSQSVFPQNSQSTPKQGVSVQKGRPFPRSAFYYYFFCLSHVLLLWLLLAFGFRGCFLLAWLLVPFGFLGVCSKLQKENERATQQNRKQGGNHDA